MNHLFHRLILLMLLSLGVLSIATSGMAQQSFGGTPRLLGGGTLRTSTAGVSLAPDFNPQDLLRQESWHEAGIQRKPYNVGKVVSCSIDFATHAELIGNTDGVDIYRLEIEMEQTPIGLNIYYSDFFIPESGRLYIYTPGGDQLLGAYTHETHPEHGAFATEPLSGNRLILDYEAPQGTPLPTVQISGIGYLYRSVMQAQANRLGAGVEREDYSDPGKDKYCQININCPEGEEWQELKSSSVIYMPVFANGTISWCSGNLINNAKGDFKPYILTAAHCSGEGGTSNPRVGEFQGEFGISQDKMDQWVFGFHYEKPRCNNSDYGFATTKTLTGAEIRTYTSPYGYSDGMLLELHDDIPLDYRVYYAGWNATETTWQSGAGIHHPAGDVTKLALFNRGMIISRWESSEDGYSITNIGGDNDHYSLMFQSGNTEGGSSGSPLYNQDKEQIGTLTGGLSTICAQDGFYGRLSSHYNKYTSKGDLYHMDMYLDPDQSGTLQVGGTWRAGYQPFEPVRELRGTLQIDNDGTQVALSWDAVPAHPQGYPVSYQIYRNATPLKMVSDATYTDLLDASLTESGQVAYAVEAVYTVDDQSISTPAAYRAIYTGTLVSEVKATVQSDQDNGVSISWVPPVNAQIISKIADRAKMNPVLVPPFIAYPYNQYNLEFSFYDKFRLGHSPFDRPLYVHQINILPAPSKKGSLHRFYLRQKVQGSREFSMYYKVPQEDKQEWISIPLNKPFELHMEENLEVGFKIKNSEMHDIYIDTNSKDEYMGVDGGLASYYISGYSGEYGIMDDLFTKHGYMAIELVVSDSPILTGDTIRETFTRGPLPVPFPEVKGYTIYRNGEMVSETDASVLTYNDNDGNESDNYTIRVRYDAPDELLSLDKLDGSRMERPYLYPTVINDIATLTHTAEVSSLQLFDLSGRCVLTCQRDALAGAIDLTALTEGSYVALIRTTEETYTQRVIIKRNKI